MERKTKRTITDVLDYETGECINADLFFQKPLDEITVYRSKLQQAIENFTEPLFGCYYCKQKIRIRGGIAGSAKRKAEIFHFAHLKDSEECHIKTKNHYTREEVDRIKYNGAKESILHQTLKENIAECLRRNEASKREVSSVEVEKVIRDKVAKEWKKPDINAFFNEKRIAIELQLSTTWLDVITKRQHFYKEKGIYIFWIFHTFNENDDVRKLTYNDVIYTNNQNAYVFDKETYELSKSENDLFLKCYYKTYKREELNLIEKWENSIVKLSDLTFDEQKFRMYYHDTESQKKNVEQDIEGYISKLREIERLKILEEQELERKRQDQRRRLQVLEHKIEDLKETLKGINQIKFDIDQKENKTKRRLTELNDFFTKVADYAEIAVKYFADPNSFNKPFYGHDELFKYMKEEFSEQIKTISQTIADKKHDEERTTKSLLEIRNQPTIEISGKTYSCISNSANWNFIKNNYSQIKIINKNQIDGLFAAEDMKSIKSDYEVNFYQYSKDLYFLTDFSSKVAELNEKKIITQEIIEQNEEILAIIRNRIKAKVEVYLKLEIEEVEIKLKNYSERQIKLSNEIDRKKLELKNLEGEKITD